MIVAPSILACDLGRLADEIRDVPCVVFALAVYRCEHGQYPRNLDALAPAILAAVPDDLFAGDSLRYRTEGRGFLLYSVNRDGADDQGEGIDRDGLTLYDGNDLGVRLPLPAFKPQAPQPPEKP